MEDDWYIGQPAPDDLVRTKIAQAAAAAYKYEEGIEGPVSTETGLSGTVYPVEKGKSFGNNRVAPMKAARDGRKGTNATGKTMQIYVKATLVPWDTSGQTITIHGVTSECNWGSEEGTLTLRHKACVQDEFENLKLLLQCFEEDPGADDLVGVATLDSEALQEFFGKPRVPGAKRGIRLRHPQSNRMVGLIDAAFRFDPAAFELDSVTVTVGTTPAPPLSAHKVSSAFEAGSLIVHIQSIRDLRQLSDVASATGDFKVIMRFVALFVLYITTGVIFYTQYEKWTFVTALYFTTVTLCTVGYGDQLPSDQSSKMFTSFFMLCGVSLIGSSIGMIGSYLVERQQRMMREQAAVVTQPKKELPLGVRIFASSMLLLSVMFIGMLAFYMLEDNLTWVDCFYLVVQTITTVGYGDVSPKTVGGRWFAIFWLLLSTVVFAKVVSSGMETYLNHRQSIIHRRILHETLTSHDLEDMDLDKTGRVNKFEFLTAMLIRLGKVEQSDLDELTDQFVKLDADQDGWITPHDLHLATGHVDQNCEKCVSLS